MMAGTAKTMKLTKTQAALLRQLADGTRVLMCGRFSGNMYVTTRDPGHHDYERVNKATFYALCAFRPMYVRETRVGVNDNKWFEITDAGRAALAAYDATRTK